MNTRNLRLPILALAAFGLSTAAFAGGGKHDKHFQMMDADGDGKVSRAEHAAGAKQMFTDCDANRDGSVTAQEMDAATAKHEGKPDKHMKNASEKIAMIDQNGDGQLTTAEHEAGSEKMFVKMDADGDGFLSREEVKAGMKMKRKNE